MIINIVEFDSHNGIQIGRIAYTNLIPIGG